MNKKQSSRRDFLKVTASGMGLMIIPGASLRAYQANEKPSIAVVGSGIGLKNTRECQQYGGHIAAVCEVDERKLNTRWKEFPQAKRYTDFRRMFDQEKLDGVVVSTPDHTHAIISIMAMKQGINVCCQKPLTRTVREARVMAEVARETGMITQMETDTQSSVFLLLDRKRIWSGALGDVTEVHLQTGAPKWPQGFTLPAGQDPVPDHLHWDLWIGPAPLRPYRDRWPKGHPVYEKTYSFGLRTVYHPFVWRGWWDFGSGILGDLAPHAMNNPYYALKLGAPISVEVVETKGMTEQMYPASSIVRFDFPQRGNQPPVKVFWYDGGKKKPEQLERATYVTSKGLYRPGLNQFIDGPTIEKPDVSEWDREQSISDWIRCIKTGKQPGCHFGYAGPLTEAIQLGNIALKVGQRIEWDAQAFRITNCPEANQYLHRDYRQGWEIPELS